MNIMEDLDTMGTIHVIDVIDAHDINDTMYDHVINSTMGDTKAVAHIEGKVLLEKGPNGVSVSASYYRGKDGRRRHG